MKFYTGSYTLPYYGYSEAGDLSYEFQTDTQLAVGIYDVTGHGTKASQVANKIKSWLTTTDPYQPTNLLNNSHSFLKGIGSAVAVSACIDIQKNTVLMSGVGNVECWKYSQRKSFSFHSKPGLLGEVLPNLTSIEESLNHGDILVIASDGIKRAALNGGLKFTHLSPENMANKMVREFGRATDDVCCMVVRCEND